MRDVGVGAILSGRGRGRGRARVRVRVSVSACMCFLNPFAVCVSRRVPGAWIVIAVQDLAYNIKIKYHSSALTCDLFCGYAVNHNLSKSWTATSRSLWYFSPSELRFQAWVPGEPQPASSTRCFVAGLVAQCFRTPLLFAFFPTCFQSHRKMADAKPTWRGFS